jgi:hypothetical protein
VHIAEVNWFRVNHSSVVASYEGRPGLASGVAHRVDLAERSVVRLRDALIELSRSDSASDHGVQSALRQANATFSLIVGVEYPAAGIQKRLLEQARDTLKEMRRSGAATGWN